MRFIPEDFALASTYGVLQDWPISYEGLEPYYAEAEEIMGISGSDSISAVSPRSRPYPLPPHMPSGPDEVMLRQPNSRHFIAPAARASIATQRRTRCCATARCNLCPVDAKFTMNNGMMHVFDYPKVEVRTECEVRALIHKNGVAMGVEWLDRDGKRRGARGERIVLGANAIHSPAILLRSGVDSHLTGVGICEQVGYEVEVLLDGIDNFGGSTVTTGLNYSLYAGDHRRHVGASLLFFENRIRHGLRLERNRMRQTLPIVINVEDAPQDANRVELENDSSVLVKHQDVSEYGKKGLKFALDALPDVLSALPVEQINSKWHRASESHLECSLRMGRDKRKSVVDGLGRHHELQNLTVVGSSVFTTCPPANPSLTVAALSLMQADLL